MATLAPLTPSRLPFGVLNDTKLRNLQSIKNRQNAITPNSAPNLKRRAPSPGLSDSENVDPNVLDSMGKRKRSNFDQDVSLCKPSRYDTYVVPSAKSRASIAPSVTTPRLDTIGKPSSTPASAPPAAGRSPTRGKSKGLGLLKPSARRYAPPSFGASKTPALSMTAALNGTLASKKARRARTLEQSKPKSWFFDIFEETEETQEYHMNEWSMTQSATGLDISDDESKHGKAVERCDRGKENVDPNQLFETTVTRSMAAAQVAATVVTEEIKQNQMMKDEPRTPLGDLNAADFYGEGLDATSVVLVHDEAEGEQVVEVVNEVSDGVAGAFTFEATDKLAIETVPEKVNTAEIGAMLAAATPAWAISTADAVGQSESKALLPAHLEASGDPPQVADEISGMDDPIDIEIWESESAKDESEATETKFDEGSGFALQEL